MITNYHIIYFIMETWLKIVIIIVILIAWTIILICVESIYNYYSHINHNTTIQKDITIINNDHTNIINSKKTKYGPITCKLKIKTIALYDDSKYIDDANYDFIIREIKNAMPQVNSVLILNYYNTYCDILNKTLDMPQDLINIILDYLDEKYIKGTLDTNNKKIIEGYSRELLTYIKLDYMVWLNHNSELNNHKMDIIYNNHDNIKIVNQNIRDDDRLIKNPFGYVIIDIIDHSNDIKIDK